MRSHFSFLNFVLAGTVIASNLLAGSTSQSTPSPTTISTTGPTTGPDASAIAAAIADNQEGLKQAQNGDNQRAIQRYQDAILNNPKLVVAYINLANSQFQSGQYAAAKATLKTAITLDPHNYVIWTNVGVMASSVGDLASGEQYFRLAIRFAPQTNDAWKDLGKVYMRESKLPNHPTREYEAIGCFKRAIDLNKNDSDAVSSLAAADEQAALPPNPQPHAGVTPAANRLDGRRI